MSGASRATLFVALVGLGGGATACEGCEDRPPIVPFQLSSGAPSASGAPGASPDVGTDAKGSTYPVVRGQKAPGEGKTWEIGKRNLSAPTGRRFDSGLVIDANEDGHPDLLAWTKGKRADADGLWFGSGSPDSPEGLELGAAPTVDEEDASCEVTRETSRIGPRTVLFERKTVCKEGPVRQWAGVVHLAEPNHPDEAPELRLSVASDPVSASHRVELGFDAADRDSDGRDDLTVLLTARGDLEPFEGAPSLDARLVYFDRPAGLSRDPAEPRRSLDGHVKRIERDGKDPDKASGVIALARQIELFERSLCDELGSPTVKIQGRGIACGEGLVTGDLFRALGAAELTLGDPLAALAQEARLATLAGEKKNLEKLAKAIDKAFPTRPAQIAHRMVARPVRRTPGGVGPFAFSGDALFVMALSGVVKIDLTSFAEEAVDIPGWGPRLSSQVLAPVPAPTPAEGEGEGEEDAAGAPPPPELQLLGVSQRCEPPYHVATIAHSSGRLEVALPVMGWFEADGRPSRRCDPRDAQLLAFGADASHATVALGLQAVELSVGESGAKARPVRVPDELGSGALGGAASADQRAAVTRGNEVVILAKEGATERWSHADLKGPEDCAVSEGARFVACRADGLGVILTPR